MSRGNSRSHNNSWIGYCRLSRTMITGYKKKKLGKPSEKLSGDMPRAGWRAVIISEVLFPIFFAILLIIAYMFVKSFPVAGQSQPSPLTRIGVVSLGPIVWNAAVLLILFLVSLFLGPMLESCCVRFGAVMATIAHILGTIGMIGFFEFFVSFFLHIFVVGCGALTWGRRSGSSSFGTRRTPCWVSSPSWPSNAPSTRCLYRCFSRANSSTTRRTGRGGLASGTAAASAHMHCRSPHVSLSSRSSNSPSGAPTSSSATSS